MNVAILFDDVSARPDATADERGVLEAVYAVERALETLGHRATRVPVGARPHDWLTQLERHAPHVAFNLCEGVAGSSAHEPRVAALIELLGIPLTGSDSETLALARRKDRVNALLGAADVAVPRWTVHHPGGPTPRWTRYPAIVKPAGEDGSVGISQRSVVIGPDDLPAALAAAAPFGLALIQEYIDGRELAVGFVGERMLPASEIDFSGLPEGAHHMVCYAAKWETGSAADVGTRPVCPAPLGRELSGELSRIARAAWRLVGGRGYGRIDLRVDGLGRAYVIEANPNPDLAPGAGLARMAEADGLGYSELVGAILSEAVR